VQKREIGPADAESKERGKIASELRFAVMSVAAATDACIGCWKDECSFWSVCSAAKCSRTVIHQQKCVITMPS
jgi:hypothetical protein